MTKLLNLAIIFNITIRWGIQHLMSNLYRFFIISIMNIITIEIPRIYQLKRNWFWFAIINTILRILKRAIPEKNLFCYHSPIRFLPWTLLSQNQIILIRFALRTEGKEIHFLWFLANLQERKYWFIGYSRYVLSTFFKNS